ncbi:MAG: phosphate ABC transporter ATP-binding protein [Chloroflexi bacterium]|nr:MAG: phosphate ABC transporter ATP-binding protein [Chloroflexota bacterium]
MAVFPREIVKPNTMLSNERYAVELRHVNIFYGRYQAVKNISFPIERHKITALIGPSGCGKSSVLRAINRMNDLVPGARVEGEIIYRNQNLYADYVDPVEVRRRIGMVFQKPNPFPKSIFDNVAYGPRLLGVKKKSVLDEIVEHSLRQAALWDEVKNDLKKSGLALSGGQQQRLCIARAIAVEPDVILMDEPASALDPIATQRIEELMRELQSNYTIAIVTHNMQQAQRASDYTAFFNIRKQRFDDGTETRWGELVEFGRTDDVFMSPEKEETADYIAGRFG